ncbi:MAG: ABC transporter substrate-binding protein [Polyangiaceae bacterium]|nr:ABC transporter substrate-binding protein [Polyangiaceae bacterium]
MCAVASGACSKPKPTAGVDAATEPRVVSLTPSTTEAVFALGAGDRMVGRSRFCNYPEVAKSLPQVGGYVDPNYEAILGLRPSLVVGARGPGGAAVEQKLQGYGVATFFPRTESFAEIEAMLTGLGALLHRESAATETVGRIHAQTEAVEKAVGGLPKRKVLLVFGLEPVVVAGPGGFPDEMLRHAGGVNVVADGPAYPTIGIERVLALDPDVVLNASMAEARGTERIRSDSPGWRDLRAVKEGHVVAITDEAVLRPGPRLGDGLRTIARAVHPEATIP